ncbi:hypothetical protein Mapa_007491 [Marchantia paleacea]|nr:hypothetical protein Mapa_007491 [Marchantia paleacea]
MAFGTHACNIFSFISIFLITNSRMAFLWDSLGEDDCTNVIYIEESPRASITNPKKSSCGNKFTARRLGDTVACPVSLTSRNDEM